MASFQMRLRFGEKLAVIRKPSWTTHLSIMSRMVIVILSILVQSCSEQVESDAVRVDVEVQARTSGSSIVGVKIYNIYSNARLGGYDGEEFSVPMSLSQFQIREKLVSIYTPLFPDSDGNYIIIVDAEEDASFLLNAARENQKTPHSIKLSFPSNGRVIASVSETGITITEDSRKNQ